MMMRLALVQEQILEQKAEHPFCKYRRNGRRYYHRLPGQIPLSVAWLQCGMKHSSHYTPEKSIAAQKLRYADKSAFSK